MITNIQKAIIPVAGLGTRMLPATKAIPKELLPVYDRPIIEHVVNEAIAGGIKEIILVTRSGKEAIENHFDAHYELEHRLEKKGKNTILGKVKNIISDEIKIVSIRQNDALGLGHAVFCAKQLLNNEPFAVLLPDVLVLDKVNQEKNHSFKAMLEAWGASGIGQVMVERVKLETVQDYGVADIGTQSSKPFESIKLKGLVEKPDPKSSPSNLALIGRYVLPYKVMDLLENTPAGIGGEIQLTDALDDLIKLDKLNTFETDATTFDCGSKKGFLAANIAVGIRNPEIKKYLEDLNGSIEW